MAMTNRIGLRRAILRESGPQNMADATSASRLNTYLTVTQVPVGTGAQSLWEIFLARPQKGRCLTSKFLLIWSGIDINFKKTTPLRENAVLE